MKMKHADGRPVHRQRFIERNCCRRGLNRGRRGGVTRNDSISAGDDLNGQRGVFDQLDRPARRSGRERFLKPRAGFAVRMGKLEPHLVRRCSLHRGPRNRHLVAVGINGYIRRRVQGDGASDLSLHRPHVDERAAFTRVSPKVRRQKVSIDVEAERLVLHRVYAGRTRSEGVVRFKRWHGPRVSAVTRGGDPIIHDVPAAVEGPSVKVNGIVARVTCHDRIVKVHRPAFGVDRAATRPVERAVVQRGRAPGRVEMNGRNVINQDLRTNKRPRIINPVGAGTNDAVLHLHRTGILNAIGAGLDDAVLKFNRSHVINGDLRVGDRDVGKGQIPTRFDPEERVLAASRKRKPILFRSNGKRSVDLDLLLGKRRGIVRTGDDDFRNVRIQQRGHELILVCDPGSPGGLKRDSL